MENNKDRWDQSYQRGDNFLFYPHEEVVRFISKYVRRRITLDGYEDLCKFNTNVRLLDLGCGIGRHVIFANQMGFDTYGIDISDVAIHAARQWASREGFSGANGKIVHGDIRKLPWPDNYFHVVLSHGVLDSVPFETAKVGLTEVTRVLVKEGLCYCDLISSDGRQRAPGFVGEEVVATNHECGTIQSYFNYSKIENLIGNTLDIIEVILVERKPLLTKGHSSRYHIILKKSRN